MSLAMKYIYNDAQNWVVRNTVYSQKTKAFRFSKFGGKEAALLEAQTWRDAEEQKLQEIQNSQIVEYCKVQDENKKLKEHQEADYKRLKAKEDLEWEKEVRMAQTKARLIKNKKYQQIQEDLDYFNECLTMNIQKTRAKWDSGVWDHLDPKGNRFVTDPDALQNWIKGYPTKAETTVGKQLIKNFKAGKPDYKCEYMINNLYKKMSTE